MYVAYPAGAPVPWPIVRQLDQRCIRAITDVSDSEPDEQRVQRIMTGCSALVVLLPYRASAACTTIASLVEEVRLAAELGPPIVIFREHGVRAVIHEIRQRPEPSNRRLCFDFRPSRTSLRPDFVSEQNDFSEELFPLLTDSWPRFLKIRLEYGHMRFSLGGLNGISLTQGRPSGLQLKRKRVFRVSGRMMAGTELMWKVSGRGRAC